MARLKPVGAESHGTYFHLFNRVAGCDGDFPFGDFEKAMFLRLMKKLAAYYTLDLLAWQVMGNHFHLVVFAPAASVSPGEAARRYHAYHRGKKILNPEAPECAVLAGKLRDVSAFMGELQHQFAVWYNRTRPVRRHGGLWADRFKSVVLEGTTAVWECIKYVELNCVRARLVHDPAEYRFGSWGEWCGRGAHPYAGTLLQHLRYNLGEHTAKWSLLDFQRELGRELARVRMAEAGGSSTQLEQAMVAAAKPPAPLLVLDRRVRYWSDGLVIGGRLFVRNVMAALLSPEQLSVHQTSPNVKVRLRGQGSSGVSLCAWRRLRAGCA